MMRVLTFFSVCMLSLLCCFAQEEVETAELSDDELYENLESITGEMEEEAGKIVAEEQEKSNPVPAWKIYAPLALILLLQLCFAFWTFANSGKLGFGMGKRLLWTCVVALTSLLGLGIYLICRRTVAKNLDI